MDKLKRIFTWRGTLSRREYVRNVLIVLAGVVGILFWMARKLVQGLGTMVNDESIRTWIEANYKMNLVYSGIVVLGIYLLINFMWRRYRAILTPKIKKWLVVVVFMVVVLIEFLPNKESNLLFLSSFAILLLLGVYESSKSKLLES